jgi:DNA-binding transcriptional MocR family regulator
MTQLKIDQINTPPDFIDLGRGDPDHTLLPLEALQRSAEWSFATGDRRPLQYGTEQGDGYFRRDLAGFLAGAYELPVDPDLLFVTCGASSALDLICTLHTQPGDVIFVEEPTYFLALRIFADHGLKVISLPMDQEGLSLQDLEEKMNEFHPKLIYIIPTFQNPTGRTISLERREKLIDLAGRHNILIVADEVYHLLAYTRKPPKPFAAYAGQEKHVISLNSFSKILAPGLRLGWLQAHPTTIQRLAGSGMLDSGGGLNPFTSALTRHLVASGGLEENIHNLCKEYASRLEALGIAIDKYLPAAEWVRPLGGFFCWVSLPGVDAAVLRRAAEKYRVGFRQGSLFSSRQGMQDIIRLSFSFYDPANIEEGVRRLGECLENS